MTLNECTKEQLLYIIKRLTWYNDFELQRILCDLEYKRVEKKLAEADNWGKIADDCRRKYIEILKKHEGLRLIDVPIEDIKEMERCLKDAKKADEKYDKLMKEVDAYGT